MVANLCNGTLVPSSARRCLRESPTDIAANGLECEPVVSACTQNAGRGATTAARAEPIRARAADRHGVRGTSCGAGAGRSEGERGLLTLDAIQQVEVGAANARLLKSRDTIKSEVVWSRRLHPVAAVDSDNDVLINPRIETMFFRRP